MENKTPRVNGQENKNEAPRKGGPRFSIYWIYAIIAAVLIFAQFMKFAPDTTTTWEQEFQEKMLLPGDVERLDLVKNKDLVRVYIKSDSIYKKFYHDKLKLTADLPKDKVKGVPLFQFEVDDLKAFRDRLGQFYKDHPQVDPVPVKVFSEGEWFGPVANAVI
ncbi:MAG TPA: hypothetical protein VG842_12485, partial [Sediminibacterium sp.]|nr:hypothetical protein [Sediminibacterium sp.]